MKYVSTRGQSEKLTFSEAVSEGLAPDGGLYVPETMPDISGKIREWEKLDYAGVCFEFLRLFADDIPAGDLRSIVDASYTKFDVPEIAPLKKLDYICLSFFTDLLWRSRTLPCNFLATSTNISYQRVPAA